jgi:phosphoribosylaminoimidazolecarboxamide formyltransferase/IMP cyclohydrolase
VGAAIPDGSPIRRALLSVSDKAQLVELASGLHALGVELVSTGGTARAIAGAGIPVVEVESLTGFPEMLDGRVKTLHPAVHGGLLARRDLPEHAAALEAHGIGTIDLLCVGLYPFERTAATPGVTRAEAIEQIDIGGPAMIRSAAKNHAHVAVLTDPSQYGAVLEELRSGGGALSGATLRRLALEAFRRTAAYDAAISAHLASLEPGAEALPARLTLGLERAAGLRYGENPHQRAATYRPGAPGRGVDLVSAEPLHGKALSYNNLLDADAAIALAGELRRATGDPASAVVVKHTNPCGAAVAGGAAGAIDAALAGDPLAAFGGILGCGAPIDAPSAERLCAEGLFLEVVVAPSFDDDALEALRARWKNLRLLAVGPVDEPGPAPVALRPIAGGYLAQEPDTMADDPSAWTHAAGPAPDDATRRAASAVWAMSRRLTSNAIAIGGATGEAVALFGAGAGQMDRVASCRVAVAKAGDRAAGAVAASDAFFPFADGPEILADAGVRTIVQPGGSRRDGETLELCERRGITLLLTGVRHFRH